MSARKSTNINELPSLNSLANQTDEDDAIAEVLEEIQNENNAENFGPQPPLDSMPQGPSQNNIPTPMRHPMQQIQQHNQNINIPQQMPQQIPQQMPQQIPQQMPHVNNAISQQVMPMNTNPEMFQQQQMQQNVLNELKTQLLAENFVDKKQKDYDNRFLKFIDDTKSNASLIIIIFVSHILLQNDRIKNLLLSKFQRFNIPYLNLVLLALVQVLLIMGVKNFV